MASQNFLSLATRLANADIDLGIISIKAMLIADVLPSQAELDSWETLSQAQGLEHAISGNYVQGGFDCDRTVQPANSVTRSVDVDIIPSVGNGNPVFEDSTISSAGAIIYGDTGNPANDPLLGFVDFEELVESTNGDFNVTFSDPLVINI